MNLKRQIARAFCPVLLLFATPAFAATDPWTGAGSDGNWGTGGNWASGNAPASADNLVFGAGARQYNSNNISGLTVGFLDFTNGSFTLNGNLLTLNPSTTGVFTNLTGLNIIALPLSLTPAGKWWSVAGGSELRLTGAFTNTAVSGTSTGWMFLTNGGTVRLMNLAQSTRGMDLFQGTVIVDGGLFDANNDGIRFKPIAGAGPGASVLITNNGTLRIGGGGNFRMGTINGTFGAATSGSVSLAAISSGSLELYGSATSIQVGDTAAGATGVFNQNGGLVWGSYSVANATAGNALSLGGATSSTGTYNLNGGILWIGQILQGNSGAASTVFNFNGGTLKPAVSSTTFFSGLTAARVQSGGAIIDTTNLNITIGQSLLPGTPSGGLTKLGSATLTLSGANTYTGGTVISNGILNITGSLSGSGAVTVASGTLAGSGAIAGAVTVQPGATISPGAALGAPATLALQNGLTLSGNVLVQVNKSSSPSNDLLTVNGSLVNVGSGTLSVNNLGTALAVGDSFKIFSQPLSGGASLTLSPSGLAFEEAWTNRLAVDGTIGVISTIPTSPLANLASLALSAGTLTPAFASNLVTYAAAVPYTNSSVTVTAVSVTAGAAIQIISAGLTNSVASGSPSPAIPLNPGANNTIDVRVASPDLSVVKDYYVSLTRTPPNVILILADDQGFSDWSCYGSEISTPNLDGLAATGLRFRNFHNAARCSPTRCSILTGLYTQQVAVDPSASLPPLRTDNNITIAELLGANGYHTYMAGKWHIGSGTGQAPEQRGFDEVFTYISGTADHEDCWDPTQYRFASTDGETTNITYATGSFYQPDALGDYCLQFLNNQSVRHPGQPFFMYVPFGSAHFLIQAPQAMVDTNVMLYTNGWDAVRNARYTNMLARGVIDSHYPLSPNEGTAPWNGISPEAIPAWSTLSASRQADSSRRMATYATMIEKMDANIGRIVQWLQQNGQLDNTLIFALSDNGGNYEGGVYGLTGSTSDAAPLTGANLENMGLSGQPNIYLGGGWAHVSNTPFRLFKHFDHNGGTETPLIIHWPQGLTRTNQWDDQVGHIMDVMATIVDVTGSAYPTQFNNHVVLPLTGTSLKPWFNTNTPDVARSIGFEHEGNRAYISGNWKFVTKNFALYDDLSSSNELELYNLTNDASETTNTAYVNLALLGQFVTNWNNWCNFVGDPASLLLTSLSNSPLTQYAMLDPAPNNNDLFLDTFDRPNDTNISRNTVGMSGSCVTPITPIGANAAYFQGYEGSGTTSIQVVSNTLWMANGGGTAENGIMYNFDSQDIANAGGFSIELNIQQINDNGADPLNKFVGFGVGLTQTQAATGGDVSAPLASGAVAFRGEVGGNTGATAFFVELDEAGNVKVWSNGALLDTIPVGQNSGVLTASFACTGFTTNDPVTVTVFLNGNLVDINTPDTNSVSRTFHWNQNYSNYIGLSARASNYAQMDNLAIRKLPLANGLITDYALSYGLVGANSAPNADPDGDGVNNFAEWAFGGNPTVPDSFIAGLQSVEVLPGNDFRFSFQRYLNYAYVGLQYHYLISSNLVNWTEISPNIISADVNEDKTSYEVVTLELPGAATAGVNKLFLRIMANTSN